LFKIQNLPESYI